MFKKVDHVTIVVKNLDEAMKAYERIFRLTPGSKGFVKDLQGTRLAMLPIEGARIELMEPDVTSDSPFARFLKEHGEGVYSYCIYVDDFDTEIKRLKEKGIPLREATQAALFPGYAFRIAWVPAEEGTGVTIELSDIDALPDYEK
jgi:methylmalonyl-CoA/ethylmalonyl-CoA epimerase